MSNRLPDTMTADEDQEAAMRVVISGTHGSGKSTLIGDFAMSHRAWSILPDPFEYLDGADATPGGGVSQGAGLTTARWWRWNFW